MAGFTETEHGGRLRVAIANAIVGLWKDHYGRGPAGARTFIEDQFVFVVLQDGLTRNEQTLLDAGREDVVRRFRVSFQETIAPLAAQVMEQVTGQRVVAHRCQIVFNPTMTFEIFVMDGPVGGRGRPLPSADPDL